MAVLWSNALRWYVGAYDLGTASTRGGVTLQSPALDRTVFGDAAERSAADVRRDEVEWAGLFEDSTRGLDALIGTLIGTVGDVMSFVVGTATGDRAYCGNIGVLDVKAEARMGDLVRVTGNFKPDGKLDPSKHFGPSQVVTTAGTSGSVDDSALSVGTHRLFAHVFRKGGAGTFILNLQDSADGTTFVGVSDATAAFTAIGSTALTFTGTLRRYVLANYAFSGGSGSTDWFAAYGRTLSS